MRYGIDIYQKVRGLRGSRHHKKKNPCLAGIGLEFILWLGLETKLAKGVCFSSPFLFSSPVPSLLCIWLDHDVAVDEDGADDCE